MLQPVFPFISPRLRQDITFLETPDGLYIRGGGCNFTIAGKGTYALLSKLLPYLDGTTPISIVLETLSLQEREIVLRFLGALNSKGLLHEGALPDYLSKDKTLLSLSTQRAFLTDLGAPIDAIASVADARVVVIGEKYATDPIVRLLRGNGIGSRHGICESRGWSDELPENALVIVMATEENAYRLVDLARDCEGISDFIPVWQQQDRVLIGPWQGHNDGPVVRSAVARAAISEGGSIYAVMALGATQSQQTLSRGAYETIAALLSFEVFKIFGCIDDGSLRLALLNIQIDTLQTVREPVTLEPSFFADLNTLPMTSVQHPNSPKEWDAESLYRRYAALVGNPCGLFTRFDDDSLRQLPIKVGLLRAPVLGADLLGTNMENVLSARLDALTTASALYAVNVYQYSDPGESAREYIEAYSKVRHHPAPTN